MKIRHYGILASRTKPKLRIQQMKMGIIVQKQAKKDWKEIARTKLKFDADACPCCKTGKMIRILTFDATGPPQYIIEKIKKQAKKN